MSVDIIDSIISEMRIAIEAQPSLIVKRIKNYSELNEYIAIVTLQWREFKDTNRDAKTIQLYQVFEYFSTIQRAISNLESITDEQTIRLELNKIINLLKSNDYHNVHPKSKHGELLIKLFKKSPLAAVALLDFLHNKDFNRDYINSPDYFYGATIVMGFYHGTSTLLPKELENYHQESTIKSFSEELKKLFVDYNDDAAKLNVRANDLIQKIENDHSALIQQMNQTYQENQEEHDKLKKLYSADLMLKEPAKYWDQMSNEYEKQGKKWVLWTVGISAFFSVIIMLTIWNLPEILNEVNDVLDLSTIKITLLIGILASIIIFSVRLCVRLALSSYHLSRDARERKQLSYFYLALLKEQVIEPEERAIVINSLFSRADTGLVKGESGPTMSDGIFQQAIKSASKV